MDAKTSKKAAVPQSDLLRLYLVFLVPILDHTSVVYHSMLNQKQTTVLEGLQAFALKTIYGFTKSYAQLLEDTGIDTLQARRTRLVDNFLEKNS